MTNGITDVVVGRQGIYDLGTQLVGYELLFRGLPGDEELVRTGEEMTAEVLFGALTIGLDQLTAGADIFCNADRDVIVGAMPLNLPPDRTVVEVLESVELDDAVIAGCATLAREGYRIALDDFVWRPGAERILPLASIVKVDLLQTRDAELEALIARCRPYDVRLLAEKVEDTADLPLLRQRGFELFQGYALERPDVIAGATIEPGVVARLRMAGAIMSGEPDFDEIEAIVRSDPALTLQLIRVASVGRLGEARRRIGTLRQALVLMGSRRIRNWAALLLARSSGRSSTDRRFADTLIRARACELLAERVTGLGHLGFAAGMLSSLEALLEIPAARICESLDLSEELSDAAFRGLGPVGLIVQDAIDFELGNPHASRRSGVDDIMMNEAFARAFTWSMTATAALSDSSSANDAA